MKIYHCLYVIILLSLFGVSCYNNTNKATLAKIVNVMHDINVAQNIYYERRNAYACIEELVSSGSLIIKNKDKLVGGCMTKEDSVYYVLTNNDNSIYIIFAFARDGCVVGNIVMACSDGKYYYSKYDIYPSFDGLPSIVDLYDDSWKMKKMNTRYKCLPDKLNDIFTP